MKKNIFFIAILGFISLSLKSENSQPFTQEEYEEAPLSDKIFTTRGQQKPEHKVLKKGMAYDKKGNLYKFSRHIKEITISDKETTTCSVSKIQDYSFQKCSIYGLSRNDIKKIAKKTGLLEEQDTIDGTKIYVATENIEYLGEPRINTLTDAQKKALFATGAIAVAVAFYYYQEEIEGTAKDGISFIGNIIRRIVNPISKYLGTMFPPVE